MKVELNRVLEIVRAFVASRDGGGRRIEADTRLLQEGIVDSFALVELIAELEQTLGVELPMGTLIPEDFESPRVLLGRLEQI